MHLYKDSLVFMNQKFGIVKKFKLKVVDADYGLLHSGKCYFNLVPWIKLVIQLVPIIIIVIQNGFYCIFVPI